METDKGRKEEEKEWKDWKVTRQKTEREKVEGDKREIGKMQSFDWSDY